MSPLFEGLVSTGSRSECFVGVFVVNVSYSLDDYILTTDWLNFSLSELRRNSFHVLRLRPANASTVLLALRCSIG